MADYSRLKKAKIEVNRTPKEEISCMFNPSEYKISTSAGYNKTKEEGDDKKKTVQYTGGYRSTLSLTLYYDQTDNLSGSTQEIRTRTSVMMYVQRIQQLLVVAGSEHTPPQITFIWGDLQFAGYLTSLNQDFTYFDIDGKPLRVKLDLSIEAALDPIEPRKEPLESPDRSKRRVVEADTSLWKLAWEEYHDCNKWVEIARFNGLMNPLDIYPGQVLRLPPLSD